MREDGEILFTIWNHSASSRVYSKSQSYLPDSLQITLKTAITNGLVYEIYQRCKHHGKLVTTQMILCLLNKKYDKLLLLYTRVRRLVTKITKLRCAAKSAYCDEVVNFLDLLKDRDVSEQIVNMINNNNVVK